MGQKFRLDLEVVETLQDGSMRVIGVIANPPVPSGPPAPENLRLVSLADDEVELAWDAVSGATSYELYRDSVELDDDATSPYSDLTVVPEATYVYQVRAVNADGPGALSAGLFVAVPAAALQVPEAPVLELDLLLFDEVRFSWEPVPTATGYKVYDDVTLLDTITATTFSHTGLTAESFHEYTVVAFNAAGDGDPSAILEVTTPANAAPVWDLIPDQNLVEGQEVNLLLTSFCLDPEGRTLTFSVLDSLPAGVSLVGNTLVGTVTAPGSSTTNLRANDGDNTADTSVDWVIAELQDTTPPTAPGAPVASANGSTNTVTWAESTDASGILEYEVQRSQNLSGTGSWATRGTIAAPPFIETGVPNGTRIYRVRARDNSQNQNWGPYSAISNEVTTSVVSPVPDAPVGFSASAQSSSVINLSWAPGPSGVTPTGYELDRSLTGTSGWTNVFTGLATSFSDTDLSANTQYFYRLRALNGAEASPFVTSNSTTFPSTGQAATWTRAPNTATVTFDGDSSSHPGFSGPNRPVQPGDIIEFTAGEHGRVNFHNIGKETAAYAANPVQVRNSSGGDCTFRSPTRMSGGFHSTVKNCFHVIFRGDTSNSAPLSPLNPIVPQFRMGLRWLYSPATTPGSAKESLTSYVKFQAANSTSKTSSFITFTNVEIDGGYHETSGQSRQTNGIGFQTQDQNVQKSNNPGMWQEGIRFLNCYVHNVEGEGFYFGPNWSTGSIPLRNCEVGYCITFMTGNDGINVKQWLGNDNSSVHDFYVLRACCGDTMSGTPGSVSFASSGGLCYNGIVEDCGRSVVSGGVANNGVGIKQFIQNGPPGSGPMAAGYPEVSQVSITVYNVVVNGMRVSHGVSLGSQNNNSLCKVLAKVYNVTSLGNADAGIRVDGNVLAGSTIRNSISLDNAGSNISPGGGSQSSNLTTGSPATLFVDPTVGSDPTDAGDYHLTSAGRTAAAGCTGTRGTDYSTTDLYGTTRSATAANAHKGASE